MFLYFFGLCDEKISHDFELMVDFNDIKLNVIAFRRVGLLASRQREVKTKS